MFFKKAKKKLSGLPSRASVFSAVLRVLPVGDNVDAALVDDRDPAKDLGHLAHQLRVRVDRGWDVSPLEDRVNQAGELEGVGGEDGPAVTLDDPWVVGQVPEAVGVNHYWNVL